MKLAEALSLRKDLQKRVEQVKERLKKNATVQEGEQPLEDPKTLAKDLDASLNKLEELIFRINQTNIQTIVDGVSLTKLMAERDVLSKRISVMRDVFDTASTLGDRYSRTEIKQVATIDVSALSKQIDALSKSLRELDYKIQAANFSTDLA